MPLARAAVVAVALASLASSPSVTPLSTQSSPIDIGSLSAFGSSFLWAVNNRNEAVGWSELGGLDTEHAILWRDGEIVDLGVLEGFDVSRALGINDRGQIVGTSVEFEFFHSRALLWQDGRIIELAPGQDGCSAAAINNRGEIAGRCGGALTLWRKGERASVAVPPGFTGAFPAAINDAGMVAGTLEDRSPRLRGFVWNGGTTTVLEPPPGKDYALANAIDASGNAVGNVGQTTVPDASEPAVWHDGKVAPLAGAWGVFHGVAWGVNDRGEVVGTGHDAAHLPGQPGGAFVWSRGRFRFLPPGSNANDINERGVAVGRFFFHESGILHGMVWPRAVTRPHGSER
jgi:probable HAF family extracellular repeat protein